MKPEEQMVIALPDVETREINDDWEFILLACDGIWDVVTNDVSILLNICSISRSFARSFGISDLIKWIVCDV